MPSLTLENFLPYRLNRIGAAVSVTFRAVYRDTYGLTVPEWRVLATLGQFEAMGAKAIGQHSAMHKTKVSRAVKALEERRWLVRQTNEADRREETLRLTHLGRQAYEKIVPEALAFERQLLRDLGPEAAAGVIKALDELERVLALR